MKTVLMHIEVTDEDWEDVIDECEQALDNPQGGALGRLVAYSTYYEGDTIPDIMNKRRFN